MKEYLSIGELASIFDITVQLLRHYDAKGLLVPARRDKITGHRMYHLDQMYVLATIRYLRKIGYSLDSIKSFLAIENYQDAIDAMHEQSALLRKKYYDLLLTDNIIQKKLAFIEDERRNIQNDSVTFKKFPPRFFTLIGDETSLFTSELFYFYPTIGFYMGKEKRFAAYFIDLPDIISFSAWNENKQRSMLPAGCYASYYHFGPYQEIYESIDYFLSELGVNCSNSGRAIITINIVDQFITSDPKKYVTELQYFVEN